MTDMIKQLMYDALTKGMQPLYSEYFKLIADRLYSNDKARNIHILSIAQRMMLGLKTFYAVDDIVNIINEVYDNKTDFYLYKCSSTDDPEAEAMVLIVHDILAILETIDNSDVTITVNKVLH